MATENCCNCEKGTDWSSAIGSICLVILIILCAGSPDLLDAITARVRGDQNTVLNCPTPVAKTSVTE
jgi:hypothetical protein